jgi:hypothetical protein
MSRKSFSLVLAILLAIAGGSSAVTPSKAGDETTPVKIVVEPTKQEVLVGDKVEVNLVLQNAKNGVAKAPKALDVLVEFTDPSGQRNEIKAVFKPQDTSTTVILPIEESGIFSIQATQPELLDDDTFIFGVNPKPRSMRSIEPRIEMNVFASRTKALNPAEAAEAPPDATAPEGAEDFAISPSTDVRGLSISRAPSVAAVAPASSASGPKKLLEIRHQPTSRALLADGIDAGSVFAYLHGSDSGVEHDITFLLDISQGELEPIPLVIKAGEIMGRSDLTARKPGEATVSVVRTLPEFDIKGSRDARFSFQPPITAFIVHASPPEISLLDTSEIGVELVDADQTPTATDEARRISLFVDGGHGALANPEVQVLAGHAVARTTFTPTIWGTVTITAATPDLISQTTTIQVTWPVTLLILSALGGLLGALVDNVTRGGPRWSVLLGAVIGFVVFWGVTVGLIDVLPRAVALNLFSAFALSFIGGAGGTELIKVLIRKLAGHPA